MKACSLWNYPSMKTFLCECLTNEDLLRALLLQDACNSCDVVTYILDCIIYAFGTETWVGALTIAALPVDLHYKNILALQKFSQCCVIVCLLFLITLFTSAPFPSQYYVFTLYKKTVWEQRVLLLLSLVSRWFMSSALIALSFSKLNHFVVTQCQQVIHLSIMGATLIYLLACSTTSSL